MVVSFYSCYDPLILELQLRDILSYENEDEVGAALKAWLANNASFKRSDVFITTKVWPHLMKPEDIEWSLNDSLKNLGVEYVDSFLIHWPFACERTESRRVKLGEDGKVSPLHFYSNLYPSGMQCSGCTKAKINSTSSRNHFPRTFLPPGEPWKASKTKAKHAR